MKPYAFAEGEGRTYLWHDVAFTMKAAAAETGGALAIWEVKTRPGEEPQPYVHEKEDEIFYILSGEITFISGDHSFKVADGGFVFIPRGATHTYTIDCEEAHLLGFSTPSSFGDNIEKTGTPVRGR